MSNFSVYFFFALGLLILIVGAYFEPNSKINTSPYFYSFVIAFVLGFINLATNFLDKFFKTRK